MDRINQTARTASAAGTRLVFSVLMVLMTLSIAACGPTSAASDDDAAVGGDAGDCAKFDSTFAAIQKRIFEGHGCTASTCHGKASMGGLDLRSDAAYKSLVGARASNSAMQRIEPGAPNTSYLYLKLEAATKPGSVMVSGSPMPFAQAPLSADELEAVRVWIAEGAPETGSVGDPRHDRGSADYVNGLLDACLPPAQMVPITPLEAPDPALGAQFEMPPVDMAPQSEWEGCLATYYDFTNTIPAQFMNADKSVFYVNSTHIRMDAASHHMLLMHSGLGADKLDSPGFGAWTCRGGALEGKACEATQLDVCGEGGHCTSTPKTDTACIGYGPPGTMINPGAGGIGTALQAQVDVLPVDGVYREIPTKGIVFWNPHAFNLTDEPSKIHARVNLTFAGDRRFKEIHQSIAGSGFSGIAPFTKKDVCSKWIAPKGATLIRMTSHTHRRGQRFWVNGPDGKKMYESFFYSDPTYELLSPPMVFDSSDVATRTFEFCATFNNGLKDDGSPDLDLVTRYSRLPTYSRTHAGAKPIACVAGKVTAPCSGVTDNAACDSTPGAGDGVCDALPIIHGETTENEMFSMNPDTIMPAQP